MTADRPWQKFDWLDQSKAWLEQQLRQSGATACAYREVHSNDRARVVKVKTSLGDVFLKAGEEPLEGLILHRLAVEAPGIGPRLFASHASDNLWAIHSGGELLVRSHQIQYWRASVKGLAELHVSDPLLFTGLPVHVLDQERLRSHFELLVRGDVLMTEWGVRSQTSTTLLEALSRISDAWDLASQFPYAAVPLHGDAHPMNAAYKENQLRWVDWAEAAVGNPLFDIGWFLFRLAQFRRAKFTTLDQLSSPEEELWSAYLKSMKIENAALDWHDAAIFALGARVSLYDLRFRNYICSPSGERPQYVSFYSRWLGKLLEATG